MSSISRASGLLLPVASLPSKFGIGDLGPESYKFVKLLAKNHQHYWSILPLSPTTLEAENSPYQTSSAYAGNPLLISPEELAKHGLIAKSTLKASVMPQTSKIIYGSVYPSKKVMLHEAYEKFKLKQPLLDSKQSFEEFCSENSCWLNDFALYSALRKQTGKSWVNWPPNLRCRDPEALAKKARDQSDAVEFEKFLQYTFFSQWEKLKKFCQKKRVQIIGDMPFYVAHDSVDVWVHQDFFSLKRDGTPKFVGGVPPDYFSDDGQLWGNPVFEWCKMEKADFDWWLKRIGYSLKVYDFLRLDHFRGFVGYWRVSASAKTAKKGKWIKAPYQKFFTELKKSFLGLPFIAEDLGAIDDEVRKAIAFLGVPGMKVLLFGFNDTKDNPHCLKNHVENSVVYTGTHDTNTARGWLNHEASITQKTNFYCQVGKKVREDQAGFEMVKLALKSKAKLCIVPVQDVLSLGAENRVNMPSCPVGNWEWRITPKQLNSKNFSDLSKATINANRA